MAKNTKPKNPASPAKKGQADAGLRRRTRMIALEPRMLFDGALGVDLGSKATAVMMGDKSAVAADSAVAPATPEAQKDTSAQSGTTAPAEKDALQKPGQDVLDASTAPAGQVKEVVFVDSRVQDYQSRLAGVDPKAAVIFLDPTKDGVAQIADTLAQLSDVTAVHIVAQGSADSLQLGSGTLDAASMTGLNAQRLSSISGHLTADATLLIHGADFGKGDSGSAVANRLALLTTADVADAAADGTVERVGTPARQEIVFVDPNVRDFQTLVDGIDNPNARVVLLDDTRDGVQQIADVVKQYTRVDAVHIISHGSEGQIDLAGSALNETSMSGQYAAQLAEIGKHLSSDADL